MLKRLIKIASQIASDFMNEKEAFDMTEREWKIYKKEHPRAEKKNHHIIPVRGPRFTKSDPEEYMRRERKAKEVYFKRMKKKHPNYVPMIPKDEFIDIVMNGEYSCISADVNPNLPDDVEKCKDKKYVLKRRAFLRKKLDQLGVKYTEVVGSYMGFEEPTFLISHDLNGKVTQKQKDNCLLVFRNGLTYETNENIIKRLNTIGAICNQDSVSHSQGGIMEFHYTTGDAAGDRIVCGKKTDIISPDVKSEYFSKGRVSEDSYTMWTGDVSNAFDKNGNLIKEHLILNPYFTKK